LPLGERLLPLKYRGSLDGLQSVCYGLASLTALWVSNEVAVLSQLESLIFAGFEVQDDDFVLGVVLQFAMDVYLVKLLSTLGLVQESLGSFKYELDVWAVDPGGEVDSLLDLLVVDADDLDV
jgi:hypothetical protein